MWEFFDSNLFQTAVIFFVGFFVFFMYLINQRNDLKKAATILIMEIRDIENAIRSLSDQHIHDKYYFTTPIINNNSWEKYKFMFIKVLDQDEYLLINNFYNSALRVEEERSLIVRQIIIGFETKCRALHENNSVLAKEYRDLDVHTLKNEFQKVAERIWIETPGFEAGMPKQLISMILANLQYVTTSTASKTLKKIAKME